MGRASGLEPYELVTAGSDRAGPDALGRRPQDAPRGGLTLTVTPLGAFAAGALAVSSLALAWTLGHRAAPRPIPQMPATADSLDEIRRLPPIPYNELPVDRGLVD